jgi:hypothetical protein
MEAPWVDSALAMVRLPSGAMVVLDKDEIVAMSNGKNRFEL